MKFIMGDILGAGGIGLIYYNTWGFILTHIIFFALIIFAIIGLITTIAFLFGRKGKGRHKETAEEKWIRTGKF